jgi:hypothetical protein
MRNSERTFLYHGRLSLCDQRAVGSLRNVVQGIIQHHTSAIELLCRVVIGATIRVRFIASSAEVG